jgi:hypothetical protein
MTVDPFDVNGGHAAFSCSAVRVSVLFASGQLQRRNVTMLKLYGFSKVNAGARGHTRDLRVLWALEEMQLPFKLAGRRVGAV